MTLREIIYRARIEHRRAVNRTQIHEFLKSSQGMFGTNNPHNEAIYSVIMSRRLSVSSM
jgi:hypothetical protein